MLLILISAKAAALSMMTYIQLWKKYADAHYKCCLYSVIEISGTNADVFPG
jgi:hypothetical protein